ncbi:MAG: septum formation inhibitor Maf [Rhodothermales bacterium]|nr:septum formation inhibitor Maf [Rhodothermales bacterium]
MTLNKPLILASESPRRRDLLRQIGLTFTIVPSNVDESSVDCEKPQELVQTLAQMKASDVAKRNPDALVLGADTTVVLGGEVVGKPNSEETARKVLGRHSGSEHTVHTGFSLVHEASSRTTTGFATTRVTFGELTTAEIDAYVRSGSPMDKAGAYGYQDEMGPLFVQSIAGDYYNVIGLPIRSIYLALRRDFADLFVVQ